MVSKRHKVLLKRLYNLPKDYNVNDLNSLDFLDSFELYSELSYRFQTNELIELLDIPEVYNNFELMKFIDGIIIDDIQKHLPSLDLQGIEDLRNNVFGMYSSDKIISIIDDYVDSIEKKEPI